jgi:hypothetical protein
MRSSRLPHLAFVAAFLALLVIGYGHTLAYPYHFDDFYSIRDNPVLGRPLALGEIWHFRPSRVVTHLSLAWNLAVANTPASLRLVNVLVHAAMSLLVGWLAAALARRLAGTSRGVPVAARVGAIASLLFVAHPLATQAVTYIVQRGTALAALFELVALATFVSARERDGSRGWAVSWAAALLAGLTKEMSVALPMLVLLTEAMLRRSGAPGRARAGQLAVYFIVWPLVGITASLPATAPLYAPSGFAETAEVGRTTYLLTQLTVIPRYLRLFIWPSGQSVDHDVAWVHGLGSGVLAGLALIVLLLFAAFAARRTIPLATLGILVCLVALIPESSLIPIRDAMVEHRMYLPMVGLTWAASAVFEALASRVRARTGARRAWSPAAALLLALGLAVATHARNRVWRDELTLWTDAAAGAPRKARPRNNRGMALEQMGRAAEAESAFRQAVAVEPLNVSARVNLSRLYGTRRRFEEALQVLNEAERIQPENPTVLNNLGSTWWALGDTGRAAGYYERALRAAPGSPEVRSNLARLRGVTIP